MVQVETGSRLHFGLLSFGQPGVRPFGGVGVMVEQPAWRLQVESAARFEAMGPFSPRVVELVSRLTRAWNLEIPPACWIEVLAAPRPHVGFGTGTQLSLAVAAGVGQWLNRRCLPADQLAALVGRGERSAIGTWGFAQGGLLVEGGHDATADSDGLPSISPLLQRLELPDEWRWLLVTPSDRAGLSGRPEREAFARLPPVPIGVTEQLCDELQHELLPSAELGDFARFSASLYRYGAMAGNCFAAVQGGPFATGDVAALVAALRDCGVAGVGQSSWGPTVFALLPSEHAARELAERLARLPAAAEAEWIVSATCNRGARILASC